MSVNSEGELSIIFTKPDFINGLGIRVKEESVITEVQGISERYSRNEAPDDSPALYIYDILCVANSFEAEIINDEITLSGTCLSGDFSLKLNGTGYISQIVLSKTDTVFDLKNFKAIN